MPALRKEGDEEIDRSQEVLSELLWGLLLESDGGGHPGSFLDPESDGLHQLLHLGLDALRVADVDWLLVDAVDYLTNGLGELELERLRDQKDVEFPRPLLGLLGVCLELGDLFHVGEIEAEGLGLVDVVHNPNDADVEAPLDWVMEDYRGVELLLLVNVVVPELDLELEGLGEVPLLLLCEGGLDHLSNLGIGEFVHRFIKY